MSLFFRNYILIPLSAVVLAAGCSSKTTTPEELPSETANPTKEDNIVYENGQNQGSDQGVIVGSDSSTPVIINETGQTQGYNYAYSDSSDSDVLQNYDYSGPSGAILDSDYSSMRGFEEDPSHYSGTIDTRIIYFGYDLEQIPRAANETLKAHADYLKSNPSLTLRIEGHADERGTRDYNIALSERRAKAIMRFMMLNGVSANQLKTVAYGEEKPAVFGSSERSWAQNRRVELAY